LFRRQGKDWNYTGCIYLIKKRNVLNAYQAINKLCKVIGESIQSKDQENTLSDYEKYLERPPTENKADNK
jgi:hypothetical protein